MVKISKIRQNKILNSSIISLAALLLIIFCKPIFAADRGPLSVKGAKQFGVNVGYGYSFESNRDIRFASVFPYFGYVLSEIIGDGWYQGTLEGIIEGAFSYVFKGQKGHCSGMTLIARYNFLSHGEHWRPYLQGGFGMVGTNLHMEGFGSDFNFTTNAAAGLSYFFNDADSFNAEWRFQHISNAGIDEDNDGLNMNIFFLGYSHLF